MMKWQLDLQIPEPGKKISHQDLVFLIGSCFSDNIGEHLKSLFFPVSANATGIIYDPVSIARHIDMLVGNSVLNRDELFKHDDLYHSFDFHSVFSGTDPSEVLNNINNSLITASTLLHKSKWLVITLGSAFTYFHKEKSRFVTNCHKLPSQHFNKVLLQTDEATLSLKKSLIALKKRVPEINVIFTVSPVRHIRDGIVENNRSKARLLESVHQLSEQLNFVTYFPAYELVIDVLRDYRFYDSDLVHPSTTAIEYVFERFCNTFLDDYTKDRLPVLKRTASDISHRIMHPESNASLKFLRKLEADKAKLKKEMPWIEI